jgi:hypothetical protein
MWLFCTAAEPGLADRPPLLVHHAAAYCRSLDVGLSVGRWLASPACHDLGPIDRSPRLRRAGEASLAPTPGPGVASQRVVAPRGVSRCIRAQWTRASGSVSSERGPSVASQPITAPPGSVDHVQRTAIGSGTRRVNCSTCIPRPSPLELIVTGTRRVSSSTFRAASRGGFTAADCCAP